MMKNSKLLLLAISLLCSEGYAKSSAIDPSILLYVHITNASNQDCVIKKHYIALGALAYQSLIPDVIFRGRDAFFSLTWTFPDTYLNTALLMTFQCGEDKTLTFYTNTPSIEYSSVLERHNMDATFTYQYANNKILLPWQIHWTIKDPE